MVSFTEIIRVTDSKYELSTIYINPEKITSLKDNGSFKNKLLNENIIKSSDEITTLVFDNNRTINVLSGLSEVEQKLFYNKSDPKKLGGEKQILYD